ncbi:MAG: hypothetical protein ACI4JB_09205, partial [Porcipelethomonas sp.]
KEVAPVITEIFDILKDVMPYLEDIVKSVIPLIAPTLETILAPVKKLVKNFLPPLVDLIKNIGKVLEPVLKVLSPVVEVVSELASLLAGVAVGALSSFLELFVGSDEKVLEFSEAEQEVIDKTKELSQAVKDNEEARKEAIKSVENEYGYYEELYDELDNIVDANGRVKEGYEERAGVITTLLNDAFGLEIEMTDGVIQKYDELKDKIWAAIEAEKYEAAIAAGMDSYNESVSMRESLRDNLSTAETQLNAAKNNKVIAENMLTAFNEGNLPLEMKQKILPNYSGAESDYALM